ncbi:MAG: fumarylacetoacetate hydrolase family protein [Betaproteobacteria bacterium]|nr:fumarylacetoacetate hydrolase family protein [Betaproteobacteria bacterium]
MVTKKAAPKKYTSRPTGLALATLETRRGYRLGIRTGRGILDVERASGLFRIRTPITIDEVIQGADCAPLKRLIDKALADPRGKAVLVPESRAKFGPAVPDPGKIICVGLNYRQHAHETGNPIPAVPILFNKYNNSLVGHRGRIKLPAKVSSQFDYEVELVIVMGRKARDVPEEKALSYVFGYASGNDFSARDLMRVTSQLMLGKTCDGFAPLGPWVVSADQIPDPQNLKVATYVNGERRQNSSTSDMIFSCAQIVSYCSRHMTLLPGDIIYTGTPQGVILGYPRDRQVWLKAGDRVVTEVEKCGALEVTLA